MRVTVQHLHSVPNFNGGSGFCCRGARAWALQHGLNWAGFVRDGVDAELLLATGDALAMRLVLYAQGLAPAGHCSGGA